MGVPLHARNPNNEEPSNPGTRNLVTITQSIALAQLDGTSDYYSRPSPAANPTNYNPRQSLSQHLHQHQGQPSRNVPSAPPPPRPQTRGPGNVASDLLPYCTIGPPLNEAQVVALSDVVGSLSELVVLALRAASGDANCVDRLEDAVGQVAAANIAEFFAEEWEVGG
ncbi:hypothetical protein BDW02DRAFT_601774 [Decorospora gaudefroyi]|uniref:Uncharacterized protein n=1 Tax=Decorospora gaudefroyi TaxID=184978 RepID=A0A6A5K0T8_9PLEO|nr:hypothetical protein BDW02DRAFT_601774 [Decorospora gaudefroyi]